MKDPFCDGIEIAKQVDKPREGRANDKKHHVCSEFFFLFSVWNCSILHQFPLQRHLLITLAFETQPRTRISSSMKSTTCTCNSVRYKLVPNQKLKNAFHAGYLWDFIYWCFRYVYIAVVDAFNYKMSYCDKEKI